MEMSKAARLITVSIIEHRTTGLLVGISDDLKGLMVDGRTLVELERRIPIAIKELLEAEGHENVEVISIDEDNDDLPRAFNRVPSSRTFALARAA